MSQRLAYLMVFVTIALTAYGQLALKWQVTRAGPVPALWSERIAYLGSLLLNPWVLSAFAAAFLASLTWMIAISRLEISSAYPVTALTFVIVVLSGGLLFSEHIGLYKMVGLALIVAGIFIGAQE